MDLKCGMAITGCTNKSPRPRLDLFYFEIIDGCEIRTQDLHVMSRQLKLNLTTTEALIDLCLVWPSALTFGINSHFGFIMTGTSIWSPTTSSGPTPGKSSRTTSNTARQPTSSITPTDVSSTFLPAKFQWGSIRRKQIARWMYLSQIKNASYCASKYFLHCETRQAIIWDQWRHLVLRVPH